MSNINPVWLHLMSQYKALCDAGQSNTEAASDLFNEAYGYAPVAKVAVDKPVDKEWGRFLDDGQIGKIETVQQTAHDAVKRALDSTLREPADALRSLELERLDVLRPLRV